MNIIIYVVKLVDHYNNNLQFSMQSAVPSTPSLLTSSGWCPNYWLHEDPFAAALCFREGAVRHSYTHSLVAEASTAVGR